MFRRLAAPALAAASLCVTLATCTDLPTGAQHRIGKVAFVPEFTPRALRAATDLAAFSLAVTNVHIVLVTATVPPHTVLDTTIAINPGDTVLDLTLPVSDAQPGDHLVGGLEFRDGTTVLFQGGIADIVVVTLGTPGQAPTVPIDYVGPGASAVALSIAPRDTSISPTTGTSQFRFAATDASGDTVTDAEVAWEIRPAPAAGDPTIDATGLVHAGSNNGTFMVIAHTLGGLRDSTNLTVSSVPASLFMITEPSSTAKNRKAFATQPALQLRDAGGFPVAVSGVTVTAAITAGGGTLQGTTSRQTDANGVATFTNLAIAGTVGERTITFSAPSLPSLVRDIVINAGTATTMSISDGDGQTAVAGTAVGVDPAVLVVDADANPVSGVTVTFAVASGGGTVTGASPTTDAAGIATVGKWKLGNTAGSNSMTATSAGLTGSPLTFTATATTGTPANVTIIAGDGQSATVGTAVATAPKVRVTDANGNPVPGVTVAYAVVTGGGSVTGASPTTDAQGKAAVGSWTLGTTVGSNTLHATVGVLSPVTFTATATAGAATTMTVHAGDNQSVTVGTQVPTAPEVLVTDAQGNPVSGVAVTFAVQSGGGSVTGGATSTNSSGLATVGSWTLGAGAGTNTLSASASGLSTVTFTATGVPANADNITLDSGDGQSATVGTAVATNPEVLVEDVNGNPVSGVTITFAVASGGGSVTGASQTTDAQGKAAVGSWTLGTVAGSNTLTATSTGLNGSPITFSATGTADVAANIAVNLGDGQSAVAGHTVATDPSVIVTDQYGNVVPSWSVTFAVETGGGSATGLHRTTDASGIATVGSWVLGTTIGPNTLSATATGVATPATFSANGIAGSPVNISLVGGDGQNATVNTAVATAPTVLVTDANANPVSGAQVNFTVLTGGGAVLGSSTVTDGSGVASPTSWTLGTTAGSNTLRAKAVGVTGNVIFTANGTPDAAATLAIHAGDGQSAVYSSAVSVPPAVLVTDAYGNAVSGVAVQFDTQNGDGATVDGGTSSTVNTDVNGIAAVGNWTLGSSLGAYTLTATSNGLTGSPLSFSATATAGTAVRMIVYAGGGENGVVGQNVPTPPAVQVFDAADNPVPNVTVTFTPTAGSGTATGKTPVTDVNGIATVGSWTLGHLVGTHELDATVVGIGSPTQFFVTADPGAPAKLAFNRKATQTPQNRQQFPQQPTLQVVDQYGNDVAASGVQVDASLTSGPGILTGEITSANTDAGGAAHFSDLYLRGKVGSYTMRFSASGLGPATQTVTLQPGYVALVIPQAGGGQLVAADGLTHSLPISPSVMAADLDTNAIPGVTIDFTAFGDGGIGDTTIKTQSQVTDGNGIATVSNWTIGVIGGTYQMQARWTCQGDCFSPNTYLYAFEPWTVTAVTAGGNHACAIEATGSYIGCWGSNEQYQFSNGPSSLLTGGTSGVVYARPQQITNGGSPAMLVAGGLHTCILDAAFSYSEMCAGDDEYGQTGDDGSYFPYAYNFTDTYLNYVPPAATQITAGDLHGCALESGTIECYGYNFYGQLGDSTNNDQSYPTTVAGIHTWISVSAGGHTTCAIDDQNDGYCWGNNDVGQLGDGDSASTTGPALVAGGHKWSQLETGGDHTCGITTSGTAMCWGSDIWGQLGDAGLSTGIDVPQSVGGSHTFTKLSVGPTVTCGIEQTTSALYCWGNNSSGQLGDGLGGAGNYNASPSLVAGSFAWTDVSVSKYGNFVCAIESSTSGAFCWGNNFYGQIGIGSQSGAYYTPLAVQTYELAPAGGRRPPTVSSLSAPLGSLAHPAVAITRQTPPAGHKQPSQSRATRGPRRQ